MSDSTSRGLQQLKQYAEPTKPEPEIKGNYGEIALNAVGSAIGGAIRNYEQTSAKNFANAQAEIAETALNATDFVERMDKEVNPKYKNMMMFSQAHRQVFKNQELIAKGISDHERKAGLNAYASTQIAEMAEARKKHGNYGDWENDAKSMRQSIIDKYGALPPNFDINYQHVKKKAQESYFRGEIEQDQANLLKNATQSFAQTIYTPDQAMEFFQQQVVDQIKNPDDPNQVWKLQALEAAQALVEHSKNMSDAQQFIAKLEEKGFINSEQKKRLTHIGYDAMQKNDDLAGVLLRKNFEQVKASHDIGKPVPDGIILNENQRPINEVLKSRDFLRMSSSQLRYHEINAESEDIADTMRSIQSNLRNDFEIDFLEALKKRNPGQMFSPITPPSIAQADVKDDFGNVLAKKGELVGMDEFLRSVDKRSVLAQTAQVTYGFDIVQSRFSVEDAQKISGVRDSLDTSEKRINFDRDFIKHLKDMEVGDPYQDFSYATGDIAASETYRQMANPPGVVGGATTILRNYQNYDSLRRTKPQEFAKKATIVNNILNDQVSQNGTKILPDVIDEGLRLFLQTNAIGATYDLDDVDSITEKINGEYHYWTRTTLAPPDIEKTSVDFRDWWNGTASFTDLVTQTQPSTSQRTAAVLASKRDYSMFKKALKDTKFATGALGDRSLQDILATDKSLTIKNHNSSLKEFVVVQFKADNTYDIVLDRNGNPLIFNIEGIQ